MFLMTHAAAGMFLGALMPHPVAAFAAGVASHAILDMIPHEPEDDLILDYPGSPGSSNKSVRRRVIVSSFDLAFAVLLVFLSWFFSLKGQNQSGLFIGMISGIAGGLLPDCIIVLTFFMNNRFLRWYFDLHNKIHFVISRSSVPRTVSVAYQFGLVGLFVFSTYYFIT